MFTTLELVIVFLVVLFLLYVEDILVYLARLTEPLRTPYKRRKDLREYNHLYRSYVREKRLYDLLLRTERVFYDFVAIVEPVEKLDDVDYGKYDNYRQCVREELADIWTRLESSENGLQLWNAYLEKKYAIDAEKERGYHGVRIR